MDKKTREELGDLKPEWPPTKREITREQITKAARLLVDAGEALGTGMPFNILNLENPAEVYWRLEHSCFSLKPLTAVCSNKELACKLWIEGIHYHEGKPKEEIDCEALKDFVDDGEGVVIHERINDGEGNYIDFLKTHPESDHQCDCYRCKDARHEEWRAGQKEQRNANKG